MAEDSNSREFGERLRRLRLIWGYSQALFGKVTNLGTAMSVSRYERGEGARLAPSKLQHIAEQLHVDPLWLETGHRTESPLHKAVIGNIYMALRSGLLEKLSEGVQIPEEYLLNVLNKKISPNQDLLKTVLKAMRTLGNTGGSMVPPSVTSEGLSYYLIVEDYLHEVIREGESYLESLTADLNRYREELEQTRDIIERLRWTDQDPL